MEESGLKGLEEERRLAYVGLTRARLRAIISHAANRRIYANWQTNVPSRFIEELPEDHVSQIGAARLDRQQRLTAPPVFTGAFAVTASRPRPSPGGWEQASRPARTEGIPVGTRVFHQKFGYGTVTAVDDNRLDIAFEQSGEKRVLDTFVERA
jgi:DNA helicase-2/ATP-dependent DNA helicase PcrA